MTESAEPIRVLHVDDEPDIADVTSTLLERADDRIAVETASSASDGLDRLAADEFDCVVSDYDMPGMDGLEFLEAVREEYPDLPFVLFTGKGSEEVASDAISAGVTDYLQKGTGTDQYEVLANRLANAVARNRAERRAADRARDLSLLRDVNRALVAASTRDEVDRAVTETLASDDAYAATWIGEFDPDGERVVPREGDTAGDVPVDPIDASAVPDLVDRIQSGRDALVREPEAVEGISYGGSDEGSPPELAVLPVTYHGDRHGVLVAIGAEPGVIDDHERDVLAEITEDAAQALHTAETHERLQRHRTAAEAVPEGVFLLDEEATIELVNENAAGLLNRQPEEVRGQPFPIFIERGVFDPDIVEWYLDSVREMLSSASDREEAQYTTEIRPSGEPPRTVEIHLALRPFDEEYRGTVGIIRDVTEREERERRLGRETRRFEAIFQNPMALIGLLAPDGTLLDANRTALEMIDASADDVVGEAFWTTPWWSHSPDLQDRLEEWVARAADGEYVRFEADHPTPEGEMASIDGLIYPVRGSDGSVAELVAIGRDITERVRAMREVERQNDRLREFADVLSHDLRSPLDVARGRLQMAGEECDTDYLDQATEALDRMGVLIEDVLTLAREGERVGDMEAVELDTIAERSWAAVDTADAEFRIHTDSTVRADPSRLQQLLENLIRNAIEHAGDDVTVTVGDLDDASGFYLADDGPGVPAADRELVFESGYTTSEEGTGFGLAIVEEIAEAHGWEVRLTDGESGGARFEIASVELA